MRFNPQDSIFDYSKFFRCGILIDTSPLIIYFLGEFDKNYNTSFIKEWKRRNKAYTHLDYVFLKKFLGTIPFEKLYITPHIFHEFYKHLQNILLPKEKFYQFFKYNIDLLMQLKEEYVDKNDLMNHCFFNKLEIGEHSLYILKKEDDPCVILTDAERQTLFCFEKDKDVLLVFVKDVIDHMINVV